MIEFYKMDTYLSSKFENILQPKNLAVESVIEEMEKMIDKDYIVDAELRCNVMISQCNAFNKTK
jgi:hypothetical protein